MSAMTLYLQSGTQYDEFEQVRSFVGWDESGSFGLQPQHEPFMTFLEFGLARFFQHDTWRYVAVPSALLQLTHNQLTLSTRHYLVGTDLERISEDLFTHIKAEEEQLSALKQNLEGIEKEMLKRLWQMSREGVVR